MDLKPQKKIFKRNITITSTLIGKTIKAHKGAKVGKILLRSNMLGHKIGEFFITKIIGARIAYRKKLKQKKSKLKLKSKKK